MAQYIDKDALVAEIESKFQKYWKIGEDSDALQDGNAKYWGGVLSCLNEVKTLIDTLEVKEVKEEPVSNDMEEAAHLYVDTTIEYFDSECNPCCYPAFIAGAQWQKQQNALETKDVDLEKEFDDYTKNILFSDIQYEPFTHLYNCAKHFFELGIKTQKGE